MRRKSTILEGAAETHFLIRPILANDLKRMQINKDPTVQQLINNKPYQTYHDMWTDQKGDCFFDMMTMVRLGASIEYELRQSYMRLKGHSNLAELKVDPDHNHGIFRRIMPQQTGSKTASHILKSLAAI